MLRPKKGLREEKIGRGASGEGLIQSSVGTKKGKAAFA